MNGEHTKPVESRTEDRRVPYSDEAVFPQPHLFRLAPGQKADIVLPAQWGLTKREYFAAQAMAGIFAHGYTMPNEGEEAAKYAVQAADLLLKELAK